MPSPTETKVPLHPHLSHTELVSAVHTIRSIFPFTNPSTTIIQHKHPKSYNGPKHPQNESQITTSRSKSQSRNNKTYLCSLDICTVNLVPRFPGQGVPCPRQFKTTVSITHQILIWSEFHTLDQNIQSEEKKKKQEERNNKIKNHIFILSLAITKNDVEGCIQNEIRRWNRLLRMPMAGGWCCSKRVPVSRPGKGTGSGEGRRRWKARDGAKSETKIFGPWPDIRLSLVGLYSDLLGPVTYP